MATHTRTHSHFFLCLQSWWWGGHSKQLRESGIERERQSAKAHMSAWREQWKEKKQVGKLRRVFAIWRGGGGRMAIWLLAVNAV